jgi:hypothetical protein
MIYTFDLDGSFLELDGERVKALGYSSLLGFGMLLDGIEAAPDGLVVGPISIKL